MKYDNKARESYKFNKDLCLILNTMARSHPNSSLFIQYPVKKYLQPYNDSTFKEIEFPYVEWLLEPHHFHVDNDLVSVIISEDIKNSDSAVDFLKNIKNFLTLQKK